MTLLEPPAPRYKAAPHRTAPHRTAPHRTAPHRTAPRQASNRARQILLAMHWSTLTPRVARAPAIVAPYHHHPPQQPHATPPTPAPPPAGICQAPSYRTQYLKTRHDLCPDSPPSADMLVTYPCEGDTAVMLPR